MSNLTPPLDFHIIPDFETLVDSLGVDQKAHDDAGRKVPKSDQQDLTSSERGIASEIERKMRDRGDEIKAQLEKYKENLSSIYHSRIIEDLLGLPNTLTMQNNDTKAREHQEIDQLRDEARNRELNLKRFAKDNGLKREPKPSDNPMQVVFWIVLIVVLETSLNATFFAVGSDRGLLGGALQAFIISFLNVMMAWLLGRFCLPQVISVKPEGKYLGLGCGLLLVGAIFFLNMFAGHYRTALEQDALKAVLVAVETFKAGIFEIKSAQGWLLTAIGQVAGTCLTTKIFLSDDPYPGYGKMYRLYLDARQKSQDKQQAVRNAITANYQTLENKRCEWTDQLNKLDIQYDSVLKKVGRLSEIYTNFLASMEGLCNELIHHYRAQIRYYRGPNFTQPSYFSNDVHFHKEALDLQLDMSKEEDHYKKLVEKFDTYRKNDSSGIKSKLMKINEQEIEILNEYFYGNEES